MDIESSYAEQLILDLFPVVTNNPNEYHSTAYAFESFQGNNYHFILDEHDPVMFYQHGRVNFLEVVIHLSILGVLEENHIFDFEPWIDQFVEFDSDNCNLNLNTEKMLTIATQHLIKISRMNNFAACLYDDYYDKLPCTKVFKNYQFLQAVLNSFGQDFIQNFITSQGVTKLIGMSIERHYLHFLHNNNHAKTALESYTQALKLKKVLDQSNFSHQFIIEDSKISFIDYEQDGAKVVSSDWFNADPVLNFAEQSRITHQNEKS